MMSGRLLFKIFLFFMCFMAIVSFVLFVAIDTLYGAHMNEDDYHNIPEYEDETRDVHHPGGEERALKENITAPIVLWWTPFTGNPGSYRKCDEHRCFFTVDRHYRRHKQTQVFMFYGTDLGSTDLPLPRQPFHQWALLHEESPKNNYIYSHEPIMTLFNHTCTFKRESDYPIPTQYLPSLKWLTSRQYMVPTSEKNDLQQTELSPLVYAHTDCGTPSDRDTYVELMMTYINVDSYGKCVHNKDLPQHLRDPIPGMDHEDFFKLIAKYKFSFAFENSVCEDYMTEKLWRPLMAGSVPVIMGSPRVREFLPSNHSAIIVEDFSSVKKLAEYLKFLNENDEEYEKYLEWKRTGITNTYLINMMKTREWGVDGVMGTKYSNFIDGFECFVCKRLHSNAKLIDQGKRPLEFQAKHSHYGCDGPSAFNSEGVRYGPGRGNSWDYEYELSQFRAAAIRALVDKGVSYTRKELTAMVSKIRKRKLDLK